MSSPWQNFEKKVCDFFATKRTPFSGSNSGITSSDSLSDRLYVECKYHSKDTESIKLMKETEIKALNENKIPLLALGNPTDPYKNVYIMFNVKNLFHILKEMDLSYLEKSLPEGTTVHKLLMSQGSTGTSLVELKEQLTIDLKRIIREKIISGDSLENVKSIGAILYMLDTVIDYQKEE